MGRRGLSKAGCTTCKVRKVKCDQGFPACSRCVSSGRTCEGYGVWGGGGNLYRYRRHPALAPSKAPFLRPHANVTPSEATYFDWFRDYSSTKLPGSFFSEFWTTFVIQASAAEPAVWHAVVALSSAHHARGQHGTSSEASGESFTLRHYTQAIRHLQPYFSAKDQKSSMRVALITCLIFVAIDLLRGHIVTAKMHFQSGLRLLQGTSKTVGDADSESKYLPLVPTRESVDKSIVEVFSRFSMQVSMSKHMFNKPGIILETVYPERETPHFAGIKQAWVEIQGLMSRTFLLGRQVRDYFYYQEKARSRWSGFTTSYSSSSSSLSACSSLAQEEEETRQQQLPSSYLDLHRHIMAGLESWKTAYEICKFTLLGDTKSPEDKKMYLILYIYHTMARIMAGTALHPGNEDVFDDYTADFELLMRQLESMKGINKELSEQYHRTHQWSSPSSTESAATASDNNDDNNLPFPTAAHSIMDVGWIPPLYYTAIKCRQHSIRWRAVALLESSGHKEGFWDSGLMGPVARKVVETEEGGKGAMMTMMSGKVGETRQCGDDNDDYSHVDLNATATPTTTTTTTPNSSSQQQQQQQQQSSSFIPPPSSSASLLPSRQRLRDVEISLSGESAEKVSLHYNGRGPWWWWSGNEQQQQQQQQQHEEDEGGEGRNREGGEGGGGERIHLSDYYRKLGVWVDDDVVVVVVV